MAAPGPLRGKVMHGSGGGSSAFRSAAEFLSIIEKLPPFTRVQIEDAAPQPAHEVLTSLVANLEGEPCVYLLSDGDFTREVTLLEALEDAKSYKSGKSRTVSQWDLMRPVYDRYGDEQVLADMLAAYLDAASDAAMQVFLKELRLTTQKAHRQPKQPRSLARTLDSSSSPAGAKGAPHASWSQGLVGSSQQVLGRIFQLDAVNTVDAEASEKILTREELIAKALQDMLALDQRERNRMGSATQVQMLQLLGRLRSGGYEHNPDRIIHMNSLMQSRGRHGWVVLPPFLNVERIELAKRSVERSKKQSNDGTPARQT